MADTVNHFMEQMVPELEDFKTRGIFSDAEIQSIVKKRSQFEYSLQRRSPEESLFLRYIKYEMDLDALRDLRRKRLGLKKKTAADSACTKRIHFIFARMLRKYKGHIDLWMQYIRYAKKSGSANALSKIYGRVLQLHPLNTGLWISAASWEFSENNNMPAARVLLQRGIRINKDSQLLWRQYLRLEMLFAQKLRDRLEVLGVTADGSDGTIEQTPQMKTITACAIPKTVVKHALQEKPDDPDFALSLLGECARMKGSVGVEMVSHVQELLKERFPHHPACVVAQAQALRDEDVDGTSWVKKVNQLFVAARKQAPSQELLDAQVTFWEDCASEGLCKPEAKKQLISTLECRQKLFPTSENIFSHASLLLKLNRVEDAQKLLNDSISASDSPFAKCSKLWLLFIQISSANGGSLQDTGLLLDKAVRRCKDDEHCGLLWESWLSFCVEHHDWEYANEQYMIAARLLECIAAQKIRREHVQVASIRGVEEARKTVLAHLARPISPDSLADLCKFGLALEQRLPETMSKLSHSRALFDRLVEAVGKFDADAWLAYMELETKAGDFARRNNLHWRAMKTLNDTTEFLRKTTTDATVSS